MLARRSFARTSASVASLVLLLALAPAAAAEPLDAATINRRIDMGVNFLKKEQKPQGFWGNGTGPGPGKGWGVGYTALAGLTLIECGVPPTDPAMKKAANVVRAVANEIDSTYELALAILFLDRMKVASDKKYIQLFAGRLISAQMASGGWGYKTHKYTEAETNKLLEALRKLSNPPPSPAPAPDPLKLRAALPGNLKRAAVFEPLGTGKLPADVKDKGHDLLDATTDNSNTHFAMIGLWAARAYDVPSDRTFALVNRRFRTSQGPNGSWTYPFAQAGANGPPAITCVALLGVAIGHVVSPEEGVRPEADKVVLNAFAALGRSVGEPANDINNRPTVKDVGGLYFLWAMERVAVLYDLQKLNKKDWYLWGAEILACHQLADGSWGDDGGFHGQTPIVNTCLALMFLRRANLTPDLSKRLVVDPSALTAKVDAQLAPKPPEPTPTVEPMTPEPEPTPTVEPKAEPTPAPKVTTPAPAPAPEPVAEAPRKKSAWPLILLGLVLAIAAGGLAFFLIAKRREDDEDESKKKKKKLKKKLKVEAATANGAKTTTAKNPVKTDVEVDEDDE